MLSHIALISAIVSIPDQETIFFFLQLRQGATMYHLYNLSLPCNYDCLRTSFKENVQKIQY